MPSARASFWSARDLVMHAHADPAASVPTTRYQRVIGPAKTYRAVEPRGWVDDATPGTLEGAAR